MNYSKDILSGMIRQYFTGCISKEQLGKWASSACMDILTGDFLYTDTISVYPFLKETATFHLRADDRDDFFPCTTTRLAEIAEMLDGKKDYSLSVTVRLPKPGQTGPAQIPALYDDRRRDFALLKETLSQKLTAPCAAVTEKDAEVLPRIFSRQLLHDTLFDLIEENIRSFLKCMYLYDKDTDTFAAQKRQALYTAPGHLEIARCLQYIDYYLGLQPFLVILSADAIRIF